MLQSFILENIQLQQNMCFQHILRKIHYYASWLIHKIQI